MLDQPLRDGPLYTSRLPTERCQDDRPKKRLHGQKLPLRIAVRSQSNPIALALSAGGPDR